MYALSNIKHNGNQYFRGDHIPELTEEQARRLVNLGVATEVNPSEPKTEETSVTSEVKPEEKPVVKEEKAEKKVEKKEEKKVGKKAEKHANPDTL